MEGKQVRRKKRAFVALLFPALLFFLVSPFAVPASALTYELGSPSLWEWGDTEGEEFDKYTYSVWIYDRVREIVVPFQLSTVFSELGITNMPGRERVVDNISSFGITDISGNARPNWSFTFLVDDSGKTGDDGITFWDYSINSKQSILSNGYVLLSGLHFIYPAINIPSVDQNNSVFKLEYSFDFYLNTSNADWVNLESTFYDIVSPSLVLYPASWGDPVVAPSSSVVVERTAGRSFNITAYFDFTFGELRELVGSSYSTMRPVITVPNMLPWTNDPQTARIRARSDFPAEYAIISGGQYSAELEAVNQKLDDIQVSINNQTTQIISGISNVIQDRLIDNTDPERQAINQEAETNIDRLKDVGDEYESQNAIVDEARRNLESIAPVTLPPEASEFISTTGEILSSPWILTLTTIGLTLGIIRIILIGVYH